MAPARAALLLATWLPLACTAGEVRVAGTGSSGGGDGDGDVDREPDDDSESRGGGGGEGGGRCPAFDLAMLDSCCDDGEARCVPRGSYPEELEARGDPCGDWGVCLPDVVIEGGEGYEAPPCISLGDAEGVCVSICMPEVRNDGGFLPQATCAASEKCVPCIHPLTGEDTGVCHQTLACDGDAGDDGGRGGDPAAEPELSCESPPAAPVVDPSIFPVCCEGAHCVPEDLVPADEVALLGACDDGGGRCVPDVAIESNGFFTAPTCTSVAGTEGRCLSTCLPDVAAQAASLPRATCAATERCAPCCDPFTGQDSGACHAGCDAGPAQACPGVPAFPTCCDDDSGHCIPGELVPDDREDDLEECDTEHDAPEAFCVPDVMQDPAFEGARCVGELLFGDAYDGVCLPECLDIPFALALDQADCPDRTLCVPCTHPVTGELSGAPGC